MKLTFYSNYLNHHQVLVAEELYKHLRDDYHFVTTLPRDVSQLKGGEDYSYKPYCILAGESEKSHAKAMKLALESDVCIFAANSQEYAVERAKQCPEKISFELGERWLKHGWLTIASPVFRRWFVNYMRYYRKANFYKLCCSSFTALDDEKLFAYRDKHYKWAYFTQVDESFDIEASLDASIQKITPLMWCSRFLVWKHPELPVQMAARLKAKEYSFRICMYGDEGNAARHDRTYSRAKLENLIKELGVEDCVILMGNRPNAEILEAMRKSAIFLFTSDRLEGWGAVANESMANGCVLVASDAIGSSLYLIKDGETGFIFKKCSLDSLTEKVEWLLSHPQKMRQMQQRAYENMKQQWSPRKAVESLLTIIDDLQNKRKVSIEEGPCSKA